MKLKRVIGLMSGTSLDGIDAALIETDGEAVARPLASFSTAYDAEFRQALRGAIAGDRAPADLEPELTRRHAAAVRDLLGAANCAADTIDLVAFHGQTVLHRPDERRTWQIGDGQWLADDLNLPVAFDFRTNDVAGGGQGAPLAPIYHAALAARVAERPVAFVNIGGVGNVTWIGSTQPGAAIGANLVAFDTGPGNGPIDDWVMRQRGLPYDADGELASAGTPAEDRIAKALAAAFFQRKPPKSLDRLDFTAALADGLSCEDGAATLTAFTARSIAKSAEIMPAPPERWIVSGGGRRNGTLMRDLQAATTAPVEAIETIGADGDMIEAEAFAYMGARTLGGLPISFPGTTGAPRPLTGGHIAHPKAVHV